MLKDYATFWADKDDPLHNADDGLLSKYASELKLLFEDEAPKSVLELGCGNGVLFNHLGFDKAERYKGVDFSPAMIKRFAKDHPGTDLACEDGSKYLDDQKYDLIFSNAVVQNFTDEMLEQHILNAIKMMDRKSTLVLGSNPWSALKWAYYAGEAGKMPESANWLKGFLRQFTKSGRVIGHWFSCEEISKLAERHGFDVSFTGSMFYRYRFHAVLQFKERD